jgi:hypothetical protein
VLWKFRKETLLKSNNSSEEGKTPTGFFRYSDYGIEVATPSLLLWIGRNKISIEEIFVHSLFEVKDQRTLALATAFYIKKKLYTQGRNRKVFELAEEFDQLRLLQEIITAHAILKKEQTINVTTSSLIDVKEIQRVLQPYEVK